MNCQEYMKDIRLPYSSAILALEISTVILALETSYLKEYRLRGRKYLVFLILFLQ